MSSLQLRIALVTIALAGCQSEPLMIGSGAGGVVVTSSAADGGSASTTTTPAAPTTTTPATSSCSDLVPTGPSVVIAFKAGPPPDVAQGGVLADGIYNLTEDTIYKSGPTTDVFTDRETIRISGAGTRLEYVTASDGFTMVETLAPVGASLNPTTLCPGPDVSAGPYYTATPDTFTVVNGLYVKVFTRQVPAADAGTPATCGDLTGSGRMVAAQQLAGPPPDLGQGGALADATYDLTSFTYYNGAGGPGVQDSETVRISGGGTKLEYVSSFYKFGMVISLAPSGVTLHDTVLCPADEPNFNMFVGPNYTATPGQFVSVGPGYVKVFAQRSMLGLP
jgi:hypothetical protein